MPKPAQAVAASSSQPLSNEIIWEMIWVPKPSQVRLTSLIRLIRLTHQNFYVDAHMLFMYTWVKGIHICQIYPAPTPPPKS